MVAAVRPVDLVVPALLDFGDDQFDLGRPAPETSYQVWLHIRQSAVVILVMVAKCRSGTTPPDADSHLLYPLTASEGDPVAIRLICSVRDWSQRKMMPSAYLEDDSRGGCSSMPLSAYPRMATA